MNWSFLPVPQPEEAQPTTERAAPGQAVKKQLLVFAEAEFVLLASK
jgi:hypothetical protein